MVASLVTSLDPSSTTGSATNVLIVVCAGVATFAALSWVGRADKLFDRLRGWVHNQMGVVHPEDLRYLHPGHAIIRYEIKAGGPITGKRLDELRLQDKEIAVLALENEQDLFPAPDDDTVLEPGWQRVVYGAEGAVRKALS